MQTCKDIHEQIHNKVCFKVDILSDFLRFQYRSHDHLETYFSENDQFDISRIVVLNSNWGIKAGKRPTKIQKIIKSMKALSATNIDIFLFGWYEFRGHLGGTTRRIDIKDTLTKVGFQTEIIQLIERHLS